MNRGKHLSMLGVTLLEIMLVLAIAAMVIVMSIRYYQSATTSQQVNATVAQIQAITAAADNLAIGPGTYTGVSTATVAPLVGANNMTTPTGGAISISLGSASGYNVNMPLNAAICSSVLAQISASKKISSPQCQGGTVLNYTYDNTQS